MASYFQVGDCGSKCCIELQALVRCDCSYSTLLGSWYSFDGSPPNDSRFSCAASIDRKAVGPNLDFKIAPIFWPRSGVNCKRLLGGCAARAWNWHAKICLPAFAPAQDRSRRRIIPRHGCLRPRQHETTFEGIGHEQISLPELTPARDGSGRRIIPRRGCLRPRQHETTFEGITIRCIV